MAAGISAKANIDGAKKFQDDLKNMTAKSKALSAQMNEMATKFDKEGKSMGDNTKARKLANEQITAQKQKISLLEAELKRLEQAGQGESTQAYKLREQLAKANTELTNMEHASDKASDGQKNLTAAMLKGQLGATAITTALRGAVTVMKSIVVAAGNAAKAVWNLGVEQGQWADALITQSAQTGVDTETLQEWTYAARFVDTEVSTMTKGMTKLTKAYAKGTASKKKSVKLTKGVTISLKDENGAVKSQAQFYLDVIDALHGMTNEAQRNKAAQEIFGKSYTDMLPLINSGTSAIREYASEARSMGIIISADNVGALGRFDDTMQRFDATISAIKTNLAVAFLPVLEMVSGRLVTFMGTVSSAISDGLQPDDVGTIVDAFFDMFKLENGDGTKQETSVFAFIGEILSRLKQSVIDHKEDIKSIAVTVMTGFVDALKEVIGLTGLKEKFLGEDGTFLGFKIEEGSVADKFVKSARAAVDAFMTGYRQGVEEQQAYQPPADTVYDSLQDRLNSMQAQAEYRGWGSDAASGFAGGMTDEETTVESAAEEEIGAVEKHTGPSAHSKSTHWGHELASGYADGIRSGIPEVSAASEAMAKAAAAPIHYSLPDYGPLREVGRWGGEMIDKYVAGINRNAWKVSSAINGALSAPSFTPMGKTMNLGGVTIVVNGAAGQDVNSLADIVMERLQSAVDRREAVFA